MDVFQRTLGNDELQAYREDGFVILPGCLRADDVQKLRSEVLAIVERIGLGQTKLRQTTQYLRGSNLDALINSPNLRSAAERLIGGKACLFMPFTAVKSANGGGEFHFHQDNQYTEFDGPGINFWFALDEMTEDNGCLWIAPRSHLDGTLPSVPSPDGDQHKKTAIDPDDARPVPMNAGDCVAFSRLTVHGSGRNSTDRHRVAYAVQFHREDVRARRPGEDWSLLVDHPRWPTSPVQVIEA